MSVTFRKISAIKIGEGIGLAGRLLLPPGVPVPKPPQEVT